MTATPKRPSPPSPPPAYSDGSEPSGDPSRTCCLVEGFEGRAPRCVQLARDVEMLLAKRTKQDEVIARLRAELAVAAPQADSGPHPDVMADPAHSDGWQRPPHDGSSDSDGAAQS